MGQAKQAPAAQVELGGRTRTLRFDMGSLIDFEDETGIDLIERTQAIQIPPDADDEARAAAEAALDELEGLLSKPRNIVALLWSMLVHEDGSLTPRQVARWVHSGNLAHLSERALLLSMADRDPTAPEATGEEATDQGNA